MTYVADHRALATRNLPMSRIAVVRVALHLEGRSDEGEGLEHQHSALRFLCAYILDLQASFEPYLQFLPENGPHC